MQECHHLSQHLTLYVLNLKRRSLAQKTCILYTLSSLIYPLLPKDNLYRNIFNLTIWGNPIHFSHEYILAEKSRVWFVSICADPESFVRAGPVPVFQRKPIMQLKVGHHWRLAEMVQH